MNDTAIGSVEICVSHGRFLPNGLPVLSNGLPASASRNRARLPCAERARLPCGGFFACPKRTERGDLRHCSGGRAASGTYSTPARDTDAAQGVRSTCQAEPLRPAKEFLLATRSTAVVSRQQLRLGRTAARRLQAWEAHRQAWQALRQARQAQR